MAVTTMMEARDQLRRLWHIRDAIDACRASAESLARLTGGPRTGGKTTIAARNHAEAQRQLEALMDEMYQAQRIVGSLASSEEQALLTMRYLTIPRVSWVQVAMRLHVADATAKRMHRRAIRHYAEAADIIRRSDQTRQTDTRSN